MPHRSAPYGTWPSPVDAALVAAHDGKPEYLGAVGEELWWTAPRPAEGGRRALVRLVPGRAPETVLPPPWNVRNRVIEYGGHPWAGVPGAEGEGPLVVLTHFADQRLYRFAPDSGTGPAPLTPESATGGGRRWCDPVIRPGHGDVVCVMEEFTGERPTDVRRALVSVPLDGSAADDPSRLRELTGGPGDDHRFLTGARFSPDGRRAAWLAWDHPAMPWDGTLLRIADVDADGDGAFTGARTLMGGPEESLAQADWAPDGTLLVSTDRTGWWNLHRVDPGTGEAVNLCPREEEFGGALWRIGLRWFAPLPDGTVAVLHGRGDSALAVFDPATGTLADAPGHWTEWAAALAVAGSRVTGIAAGPYSSYEIVELDTGSGHSRVVAEAHRDAVDPALLPRPQERTFRTADGKREVHAHVYPPRHPECTAPESELPPYVIWVHGGPTGRVPMVLDLEIAYFTSRGIGVAEVNYGGSTGYGRAYRNRLRGQWGVVDVEDCAAVARALADEGSADPERLAIRGGSAGGWTSAASLTSSADEVFACGTVTYPILDLEGWATGETHDFESQYLRSLVGDPGADADRYHDRSPVNRADRVRRPFLLLQGLDDVICPPVQCERFLERVAGQGVPHAYLTFGGEGHGFRRADTLVRAVEAELSLYLQTFGIERDDVPKLDLVTEAPRDPAGTA
ncbi:prolyl oligopeptidase family serine peptidase [Streptomyces sp. TR02-1]|uniref:S9 family peptidase n=1 Tax=Streptomyces sp. TR02-1 TaxID=3385977 RepID=UPI0039A05D8A